MGAAREDEGGGGARRRHRGSGTCTEEEAAGGARESEPRKIASGRGLLYLASEGEEIENMIAS